MRKPQKIKGIGLAVLFYGVSLFKASERYVPALGRVYFQSVLAEPVLQGLLNTLCIVRIADCADEIIGVSYKLTKSSHVAFHRRFKPFVQYIMQEDIG